VGSLLALAELVALVAGDASFLEMRILPDQGTVDEKPPVIGLRLDRRRRTCSPPSLAGGKGGNLAQLLQQGIVCMAADAAAFIFGGGRNRKENKEDGKKNCNQGDLRFHRSSGTPCFDYVYSIKNGLKIQIIFGHKKRALKRQAPFFSRV
jgi:hypothetical protein